MRSTDEQDFVNKYPTVLSILKVNDRYFGVDSVADTKARHKAAHDTL